MNAHDVDDDVRSALGGLAASIEVPGLLPLAQVEPLAGRRGRRRQIVGGLATVILVAMVTISVGVMRQGDTPNAVFAGQVDQPLVPAAVIADGDRFVGMAVLDPFDRDDEANNRLVVVTSIDAKQWDRVEGSPIIVGRGRVLLGHDDGLFHVVATRGVEAVALDGTSTIEADLLHATSTDLVTWSETTHSIPNGVEADEADPVSRLTQLEGMAFVESGPIVHLSHYMGFPAVDAELDARGVDTSDVCDFAGQSTITRVRLCGETDPIEIASPPFGSVLMSHELASLGDGTVDYRDIPEVDDGRPSRPAISQATLYQTDDGIGISSRDVFESIDGTTWEQIDLGREPAALITARGNERVFRSVIHVERYQTDDPVTGMGYSDDGGKTWVQADIEDLFVDDEIGLKFYHDLTATPNGWLVVAGRTLKDRPGVAGVERDVDGESMFAVTVDGYVFTGEAPFGVAELRDPDGAVVRAWDHFEVANPVWSGLEAANGDFIIRTETGDESVTVTAEQWNALIEPHGPTTYDVLFSEDGINWMIMDSSALRPWILATSTEGVIVERWAIGNYSEFVPRVEVLPFPVISDE